MDGRREKLYKLKNITDIAFKHNVRTQHLHEGVIHIWIRFYWLSPICVLCLKVVSVTLLPRKTQQKCGVSWESSYFFTRFLSWLVTPEEESLSSKEIDRVKKAHRMLRTWCKNQSWVLKKTKVGKGKYVYGVTKERVNRNTLLGYCLALRKHKYIFRKSR